MCDETRWLLQLKDYIGEATAYDKKLMLERRDPVSWLKSVGLTSSLAGQGVVANGRVHWLVADNQDVYFQAKAGAGDVKAELTMEPGEWVSAELIDPAGRIVDRCEKRSAGVILVGKRAKDAPSEIWRLHATKFMDDCLIRIGAATSGVYAHEKDVLLAEKSRQ